MTGRPLGGARAAWILARMSLLRLRRHRTLWISIALGLLPAVAALVPARTAPETAWSIGYTGILIALAILAPLHFASAIAEEIEDRTCTFLWSRPLPRWSLVAGKLAGLLPVLVLVLAVGFTATFVVSFGHQAGENIQILGQGIVALVLGALAAGSFCVAASVTIPRQATAIALVYLVALDTALALVPFSLRNLTIRYHIDALARDGIEPGHILWLVGMTALWLVAALWQIHHREYAGGE